MMNHIHLVHTCVYPPPMRGPITSPTPVWMDLCTNAAACILQTVYDVSPLILVPTVPHSPHARHPLCMQAGNTPLILAAGSTHPDALDVVVALLKAGAEPARIRNLAGQNAIDVATSITKPVLLGEALLASALLGNQPEIDAMLTAGADIDYVSGFGTEVSSGGVFLRTGLTTSTHTGLDSGLLGAPLTVPHEPARPPTLVHTITCTD